MAPPSLLELICCSCKSDNPCSTKLCGCRLSELSCTSHCKCDVKKAAIRQVQLISLSMKMWMELMTKLRTIIIRKQTSDVMKITAIMIHVYIIVKIMQTFYSRTKNIIPKHHSLGLFSFANLLIITEYMNMSIFIVDFSKFSHRCQAGTRLIIIPYPKKK